MSKNPLRRLRAVMTAGLVIAGLSAALPAAANLPSQSTSNPSNSGTASGSDVGSAAAISATTVIPASTFVDSVGVGVHLTKSDSSYANYAAVKSALLEMGIHHVRDGISWQSSKYLDLNRAGIKTLATVSRRMYDDDRLDNTIGNVEEWRPALSGIGGPNEFETTVSDWVLQAAELPGSDLLEGERQRDAERMSRFSARHCRRPRTSFCWATSARTWTSAPSTPTPSATSRRKSPATISGRPRSRAARSRSW